jgi:hypothetical protein
VRQVISNDDQAAHLIVLESLRKYAWDKDVTFFGRSHPFLFHSCFSPWSSMAGEGEVEQAESTAEG